MIKAVIIDDVKEFRNTNRQLLNQNFPDIEVVGEADGVETGIELITREKPNLVLLDIEINGGSGFNILQRVKPCNFMVIFITAFDEFAIKAIKFSAIDYILKPVNEVEFCAAVEQALKNHERNNSSAQIENMVSQVEAVDKLCRLVLRTQESIFLVETHEILYCESDNSYTTFYLQDGQSILVSKSIKEYEQMLTPCNFFRPHQRFLVNLNKVTRVDKAEGGNIILKNNKSIPVSFRRKQALFEVLAKM